MAVPSNNFRVCLECGAIMRVTKKDKRQKCSSCEGYPANKRVGGRPKRAYDGESVINRIFDDGAKKKSGNPFKDSD